MKNYKHLITAFVIAAAFASCNNAGKTADGGKTIPAATGTMFTVMHSVTDYNKFKEVFNGSDSLRKAYGLNTVAIGRGIDDANMVMVANTVDNVAKAKEFAASPNLKEAMQAATVSSEPKMDFITMVRNDMSKIDQTNRVMVKHHVKDFDAWLKVYDGEGMAKRAEEGLVDRALGRGADDPNMVYIVFAVNDMAKAKAAMGSEDKKKLMTDAGVDSAPEIFSYNLEYMKE